MEFKYKEGIPMVAELVDFQTRVKAIGDAPENDGKLIAIVATRCAIDLDHLARIISSPTIQVGQWTLVDQKKPRLTRKKKRGK